MPLGVIDLRDAPHGWVQAVRMAMMFLDFDELPKDEQPPKKIWLDNERLKQWFDRVERDREKEKPGNSGAIEDPVDNAAAKGLISG